MKINKIVQNKIFLILLAITIFGFITRIIGLEAYPNGFARDEAYLGYNAFSILETGKDINGNFMPIFLESFLYTPAGYSYLSIPFIKLLGLNIFSVRFASALFGSLTIPLIYLLVKSIFSIDNKTFFNQKNIILIGIFSSLFLAITPWHINLSRTASVTTVVVFFIVAGIIFLSRWATFFNKKYIIIAFICFLFSLFLYIAPYSFIPFFLLLFYFLFRNKIRLHRKIFILLFVLFLLPIVVIYTNTNFSLRVQSLSLTRHPIVPIVLTDNASRDGVMGIVPLVSRFFHNKATVLMDLYTTNYFEHLSYRFLFTDMGFPDRYRIPEVGIIYPILLIFILIGTIQVIQQKNGAGLLLIGWVLISPLGSAFANDDVPNVQRILFMLPPLIIFSGIGLVWLIAKKGFLSKTFVGIVGLVVLYQMVFYYHQYTIHENAYRPWYRQEGYEELVEKINKFNNSYDKVVVTNRESAPTIFLAFYNQYDPNVLQEAISKSSLHDTDRISFGKYEITQEECPVKLEMDKKTREMVIQGEKGVLYINSGFCRIEELPETVRKLDSVKRTDGSTAFYLLDIK